VEFWLRATENATSHGERCREDARVHYEEVNVHARRAAIVLAREDVSVGSESQLPDLWELNSVSGSRAFRAGRRFHAGSLSEQGDSSTERSVRADRGRSSTIPLVSSTIRPGLVPGPCMATYSLERR